MSRPPTLRYTSDMGPPPIGGILLGYGDRVRSGYLILAVRKTRAPASLGRATFLLHVERMSKARALAEIATGVPRWNLVWNSRKKRFA